MKCAFLFPGQGSQYLGMLGHLPKHSEVSAILQEASALLGENVLAYDQAKSLQSTVSVQLALFLASVAAARVLLAEGAAPDMVAGHSVGAFAAAVVVGAVAFEDALLLVKLRGELMERAYPHGFGMGVVLGMSLPKLTSILDVIASPEEPLFIANWNGPDQITVSGSLHSLENLFGAVRAAGARKAMLLNVKVPSHCPLMNEVACELAEAMRGVAFSQPRIPYAGNYTTRTLYTADAIRDDLAKSIAAPVHWHDLMTLFYERGARLFVEMPPGRVLTDLMTKAIPAARAVALADTGVRSAVLLAQRMKRE